jgi:hypothetical protein
MGFGGMPSMTVCDQPLPALDDWAAQIAGLDPSTRKEILAAISRLAENRRLNKLDRDFAQAQVDAIRRALRRAGAGKKQSSKIRKKKQYKSLTVR